MDKPVSAGMLRNEAFNVNAGFGMENLERRIYGWERAMRKRLYSTVDLDSLEDKE